MDYELLPIGTVVELKHSSVPVMIAGYLSVAKSNPNKLWDYSGFIFPIGYVGDDDIYSFNHNQIDVVIAYGYKDIQEEQFIEQVAATKKEIMEQYQTEDE